MSRDKPGRQIPQGKADRAEKLKFPWGYARLRVCESEKEEIKEPRRCGQDNTDESLFLLGAVEMDKPGFLIGAAVSNLLEPH